MVSLVQTPIQHSVLEFGWIAFILSQTGFLSDTDDHSLVHSKANLVSVLSFLGIFAGYWSSGTERATFASIRENKSEFSIPCDYVQLHFRLFTLVDTPSDVTGSDGLLCRREQGQINYSTLGTVALQFKERRVSIFGILSSLAGRNGAWNGTIRWPSMYRVLILAEEDMDIPFDPDECKVRWRPGWGAMIAFQTAIFLIVKIWETEWNNVLDEIDNCLRFQLNQTLEPKQISSWMFDLDFGRSRVYFTILQVLRIFKECI